MDVVVEGEAVRVTNAQMLDSLAAVWATKWDGRWRWRLGDGCFQHEDIDEPVLVFSVTPAKVLAFAKGDFGQTSHRF